MSMVGAESVMIDEWIKDTLSNDPTVSGIAVGGVHLDLAPPDVQYPFIVYQAIEPPRVIRGLGVEHWMVDGTWQVKGTARGVEYLPIAPLAHAIHDALVTGDTDAVSDGYIFTCTFERQVMHGEPKGQVQFRHLGGEYRIQAQAS